MEIIGKYSRAVVYTDNIESEATAQIFDLLSTEMTKDQSVRVMPDVHSGIGCVIGYTQTYSAGPLDPDVFGVDLGCGVLSVRYKFQESKLNLPVIDHKIRETIPLGHEINQKTVIDEKSFKKFIKRKLQAARSLWPGLSLYQDQSLSNIDRLITKTLERLGMDERMFWKSLGTLGGGNHFIELGHTEGDKNTVWLTIHTGSRNLGTKVWSYWKKQIGKTRIQKDLMKAAEHDIKKNHKGDGPKIRYEIEKLHASGKYTIPPSRFLVLPEDLSGYLGDMFFAQAYAEWNRKTISDRIKAVCKFGKELERVESIHNYLDPQDRIIRKGAIKSYEGERLVIPMNMAFGTLVCRGKGNSEWNFSSPHGAGRLMSRKKAKESISLEEFKESMGTVFSTSICESCVDEAPGVYKDPREIMELIKETAEIEEIIKPLLSIKAGAEN